MNIMNKIVGLAIVAAATIATVPVSATSYVWTQGGDGDVWGQPITPEFANQISFFGEDTSYGSGIIGPLAHSHGQPLNWSIVLTVDGTDHTVFTQFLPGGRQTGLNSLGIINFAGGTVSAVGFSCDDCGGYTYHQFNDTVFTLGVKSVPEPASWAMLIAGFGLVGAAARRQRAQGSNSIAA